MIVGGETLLMTGKTGILGNISQDKHLENLYIYFAPLRHHLDTSLYSPDDALIVQNICIERERFAHCLFCET